MNTEKPRQTRQRTLIRELLGQSRSFVSAQQLHQLLHSAGESIGLATVYRTLSSLAEQGEADTITVDGEVHYRACSAGHHHHLICRNCQTSVEINGGPIEEWTQQVAQKHGFHQPVHEVEVYGICSDCWTGA